MALYNLDNIKAIDDAEDFILQVISIFLETVPANVKELITACDAQDWEQVYFYAHKIKSNVKLFNISSIIDDILFIEEHAKAGTMLEEIPERIRRVDEVVSEVKQELKTAFAC